MNLEDELNELLSNDLLVADTSTTIVLEGAITRAASRRDEIDELFQGLLRPGNRLELWDGLHDKWEVESAIAPEFDGVLDLSACNSSVLANFLNARRGYRFRTVQFPDVVDFLWAATCVKGTLQLVAAGAFGYQEARLAVTNVLNSVMKETRVV